MEITQQEKDSMMRRVGFTLIELLITIAIMIILAGILFPVLSAVKGRANQTKCASNLRQIGFAISMYSQDFDDTYPIGGYDTDYVPALITIPTTRYVDNSSPVDTRRGYYRNTLGGIPTGGQDSIAGEHKYRIDWEDALLLMGYLKSFDLLYCPSASSAISYRSSYGCDLAVMGWMGAAKTDQVPYPTNTALITEKTGPDFPAVPIRPANSTVYYPLAPRHNNNQLNVLFADNHIRSVSIGELIESPEILWTINN